jgi:hypothetical protein
MAENGVVRDMASAPIGTAVADLLREPKRCRLEFLDVGMTMTGEDATHGRSLSQKGVEVSVKIKLPEGSCGFLNTNS